MFACVAALCRKQWQRVKKPFSDSVACVYLLSKHGLTNWSLWADEDCRQPDGAVGVARPFFADNQKAKTQYLRQCFVVCSTLEVERAADMQVWRRDATTVTVFMPDGAVKGNLLELTP